MEILQPCTIAKSILGYTKRRDIESNCSFRKPGVPNKRSLAIAPLKCATCPDFHQVANVCSSRSKGRVEHCSYDTSSLVSVHRKCPCLEGSHGRLHGRTQSVAGSFAEFCDSHKFHARETQTLLIFLTENTKCRAAHQTMPCSTRKSS